MSAFLHPAYWGALVALLVGIGANVAGFLDGTKYDEQLSQLPTELATAFTVTSIIISVVLAVRYYIAVSINIYSGIEKNVFSLPPPLSAIIFFFLCALIFLCNTTVVIFGLFGPIRVLTLGPIVNIISLIILIIMWIAHLFRPGSLPRPPATFVIVELLLLGTLVTVILFSVFDALNVTLEEKALIAGAGGALVIVMFLHEFWLLFRKPLIEQGRTLIKELGGRS